MLVGNFLDSTRDKKLRPVQLVLPDKTCWAPPPSMWTFGLTPQPESEDDGNNLTEKFHRFFRDILDDRRNHVVFAMDWHS